MVALMGFNTASRQPPRQYSMCPTEVDYPVGYAWAPSYFCNRFMLLLEKYGPDAVRSDVMLKRERELWIGAAFLLGYMKYTGKTFWLRPGDDSTPDVMGYELEHIDGGIRRLLLPIEIFEWEKHSGDDLYDHVLKKLKNKKYPNTYTLVCYVRDRSGHLDARVLGSRVKALGLDLREIWLLLDDLKQRSFRNAIVCIHPVSIAVEFDITDEARANIHQHHIHFTGRGFQTELTSEPGVAVPLP